jgi:2,4-dienoyl-CoA reductase-like NADH-dependent reductase (Old Yellow Enzyme family)/thioredoxin reductase
MKSIRSSIGRRQFLVAAGLTSAVGLGHKKLEALLGPGIKSEKAMASEKKRSAVNSGDAGSPYPHLLSPLKIGNVVLKNRMMHTRSLPHFLQGPELFPSEQVISHYAGVAKTAAVVTCKAPRIPHRVRENMGTRGDICHMTIWDVLDPSVQNYFSQLADAIHFYGAKASIGIHLLTPDGYGISEGSSPGFMGRPATKKEAMPVEMLQDVIDDAVTQCQLYQGLGFDMVNIYMCYQAHILAHALSPLMNKRTDKYGGSLENRARFPLELFQAVKKACGPDFLIDCQISGAEPDDGGFTIEDVVKYAKIWEDSVDILQLRAADASAAHPMGWNSVKEEPVTLKYAEAVKKSGAKLVVAPVGGYQYPDQNDSFIGSGKTDMLGMARAYICDPDYSQKIAEGRDDDVIPCIRCNKCHGDSTTGPWFSFCSVNPELGIAHRVGRMVDAPVSPKKVAVIGGGPAGMKAAVIAATRGHSVTLYEKNAYLGGMLHHSDFAPMRWPLKEYKDYLIRQVKKGGVDVKLGTSATPEMIKAKGYDAIIVAAGAQPIIPRIPGADGKNVWNVGNVYANEKKLGKNVVLIGGGEFGAGTGGFLAQKGHKVTLLVSGKDLVPSAGPHQVEILLESITDLENFSYETNVLPGKISNGKVSYTDAKGAKKSIDADDVVIYAGRKARTDEALKFYGAAPIFFIVGDCDKVGNVQTCSRTAYAAASQIV